jgi:hypothetical protein
MNPVKLLTLISILFLLSNCTSVDNTVRTQDRFSTEKVYAILLFECPDNEISLNLSKALSDILTDYGFKIISRIQFTKIIEDAGLTEEIIRKDYSKALNKLKGIDAIIGGTIILERGVSSGALISSSSSGGYTNYISSCQAQAIDIKSGEIISGVQYQSPSISSSSSTISPAFVADKLARKFSPH